ncbi:MFS transporter [Paenibacillus lycopersici]|uniref:MFS transporter n=1 Tax=Paenibacillus lycopersici TaxID=2704462 RepID=A0A6C0FVT2_9BACL|nr:MFS transporter [Paenibacillus lycopersici]QHT60837.1 MFS transporter [Paenibacillus lycopersici]
MWTYTINLVRDLSPGVKRFIATESLFGIGAGIFGLILNLHLLDLGFSKAFIGQITSLGALTVGLTSLPAGLIVKRVGRKKMLVIGMLLAFVSLVLFGAGTGAAAVIAAQLIWSLGMTAVVNSEIQLIFQYCRSKKEETSAYSLLFAVFTFFTGVGTWVAGYLPDWMPGHSTVYQYAFFAAGGCLALAGILRGALLPSTNARAEIAAGAADSDAENSAGGAAGIAAEAATGRAEQAAAEAAAGRAGKAATEAATGRAGKAATEAATGRAGKAATEAATGRAEQAAASGPAASAEAAAKAKKGQASYRFLLLLAMLIFTSGFTFGLLNPFLNVILKFRFGMEDGLISGLLALSGFFFFIGSLAMPYCVERFGSRRTFVGLFLFNAIIAAAMAASMPAALFAGLLLARGAGFTMLNNLMDSECMSAVDEDERNLFAGMRTVSRSVGNTIASYWAGYILAGDHYAWPFLLTAAAVLAGYAIYARFVQGRLDRRLSGQAG